MGPTLGIPGVTAPSSQQGPSLCRRREVSYSFFFWGVSGESGRRRGSWWERMRQETWQQAEGLGPLPRPAR